MEFFVTLVGFIFWMAITFATFKGACQCFNVKSYGADYGFFDGYLGVFIYSSIVSALILFVAYEILTSLLLGVFTFISGSILIFFLVDLVFIGLTFYGMKVGNLPKICAVFVYIFTIVVFASAMGILIPPEPKKEVPINNTQQTQKIETNKNNDNAKPKEKSNSNQSSSKSLASYRNDKDTFDNQIVKFSEKINGHLQQSPNFKNTSYDNEGRQILQNIKKDRDNLSKDSNIAKSNGAEQKALLHLYDLEITRIQGMIDGITASKNGGDFTPGFRSGTSAAYEFDDANAAYKKDFK